MTSIENQEIKGVTAKLIYALVVSTFIICSFGFAAFYGLKMEMMALKNQGEIRQVEFDNLKNQVAANTIQIRELSKTVNELKGAKHQD